MNLTNSSNRQKEYQQKESPRTTSICLSLRDVLHSTQTIRPSNTLFLIKVSTLVPKLDLEIKKASELPDPAKYEVKDHVVRLTRFEERSLGKDVKCT